MNNFEKIKQMNVEEMAEIFNRKFCEECAYKEMNFEDWKDCFYKKWKRKEQECKKLNLKIIELNSMNETLKSECENCGHLDLYMKLKQTLTEIKEIVKPHQRNIDKICGHCRRYDGCHACCIDDINCYQYKKTTTPACDKYCELKEFEINNIANQILQKISEVENANF